MSGDIQLLGIQYLILFFCVPFLKDSLFLISCCRNEQSFTQFLGLRSWERVTCLAPSVTPSSDLTETWSAQLCGYAMVSGPSKMVICLALFLLRFLFLFFCVPFLKDSLFLISCCRNKQSFTPFPGLRSWERAPAWSLHWLPPLTSLKSDLLSYAPLTQDMQCFLALWRLLFAWLCFCPPPFFLLPKAALYEDI